ncbi:MAG TPA: glycosyltransferase family 2 protein [Streptosporangiaceae bacterium]
MIEAASKVAAGQVSVVVCTYDSNRRALLDRGLAALQQQQERPGAVIVVVDHNPPLLAALRAEYPQFTVVPNDRARGLSGARNCGLALTATPVVAFLDDDAVPQPDWVAQLALAYGQHVVGVGGAIIPAWAAGRPSWFPAEFDWVVGCTYKGARSDPGPVRNMLGANMSFRTIDLRRIGGFRDGIGRIGTVPLGCEETEACIRMGQYRPGDQIRFEPAARVHHYVPAERATWRYLLRRCWAEGLSKARVATLTGRSSALSDERGYATRTLPKAVAQALGEAIRGMCAAPLGRAIAVMAGLTVTTAGFLAGQLSLRAGRAGPAPQLHDLPSVLGVGGHD